MRLYTLLFLVIIGFCYSCNSQKQRHKASINKHEEIQSDRFMFPKIHQSYTKKDFHLKKEDHIYSEFPMVVCRKFSYSKKLVNFPVRYKYVRNFGITKSSLLAFFSSDEADYSIESTNEEMQKLNSKELSVLPDYLQNVAVEKFNLKNIYFPVYVVNQSTKPQLFAAKDNHVFAIQEAMDKEGKWRPIEMRGFDFCGNGHWFTAMKPKEYMMFLVPKYSGNYKTQLRIRLRIGNEILFSEAFEGNIRESQFYLPENKKKEFESDPERWKYIRGNFYGTLPLEFDKAPYNEIVGYNEPFTVVASTPDN